MILSGSIHMEVCMLVVFKKISIKKLGINKYSCCPFAEFIGKPHCLRRTNNNTFPEAFGLKFRMKATRYRMHMRGWNSVHELSSTSLILTSFVLKRHISEARRQFPVSFAPGCLRQPEEGKGRWKG